MRRLAAITPAAAVVALCLIATASPADAHAFGVRYDLPLPFSFYLAAAGAVVALSFAAMALLRRGDEQERAPLYLILVEAPDRLRGLILAGRVLGALAFLLILLIAFFGPQSPMESLASVTVWVLWWVGFLLVTALIGNLWPLIDPWRTMAAALPEKRPRLGDPAWAGTWPAVFLLLAFIWMELVGDLGHEPRGLARIILSYSVIVWLLAALFGADIWRARFDPFDRLFALMGAFAPLGRFDGLPGRPLVLRLPGAGLLQRAAPGWGESAFLLVVLASVTFDGFSETPAWAAFLDWAAEDKTLRPLLLWAADGRLGALGLLHSAGLIAAPLLFAAILWVFCVLASLAAGGSLSSGVIFRHFAITLLPIAIAYHLSHYASYLLFAGQLAIPLASDPFGLGWNLFGTRGYLLDMGVIGAKEVWYLSVFAIVLGHVFAVVLAHVQAQRLFPTAGQALRSQVPLLVLMILFTLSSLWILAQPVVAG